LQRCHTKVLLDDRFGVFMKNEFKGLLLSLLLLLVGCNQECTWALIEIGQQRSEVISVMGEPNQSQKIRLPLGVDAERLIWKNLLATHIYQVDLVLNRVIDKQTVVNELGGFS
jgi:hypothetical protein